MLCVVRALRVSSFLLGVFAGSLQAASEPPAPVLCIFNDTGCPILFSWHEDGYTEKLLMPASFDHRSGASGLGYVVTHLLPGRTRFRVRFEGEVDYAWFFDSKDFPREAGAPFYCELRWRGKKDLVLQSSARRIQPPRAPQHASPTGVIGMPIKHEGLMSVEEMALEFGL